MPSNNFKVQLEVDEKLYESWKQFLSAQGYVLYGKTTHLNTIAMEEGIKTMMKNKKKFNQLVEEKK